ncbi:hypothetical protein AALH12_07555 [Streptococcus ferus]|uniref:hypothetical protein n=1 Tax=Streptococcus ferus TaxID=1345 RepID=UPI0035126362
MIITVLDNTNTKIATIDNESNVGLTFKDDTYHEYLKTNAVAFDFTIPKLQNGKLVEGIEKINDASRFEIMDNGQYQKFYIYSFSETFTEIKISCNNLALEVLSEVNAPWINTNSVPVDNYIWNLLSQKGIETNIGINEIPDRRRTISFEDTGTKISRLQTVASQFDCEFELKTNKDSSLTINIYDTLKESYRGTSREDILFTEQDFKDIEYTTSKEEMYNRVSFSGVKKNGDTETTFDLTNQEKEWKNSDGVVEFVTKKGNNFVDAPLSRQKYSLSTTGKGHDDFIFYTEATEYQTEADLLAYAYRFLKDHAYPAVTLSFTVAVTDKTKTLKVGDRIRVDVSSVFSYGGIWSLTISELEKSFTNPSTITLTVQNVINRNKTISSSLVEKMSEIANNRAPYVLTVTTDDSLLLKGINSSAILTASATRNNQIVRGDYKWLLNGQEVETLPMYMLKYDAFDNTANIECQLIVDDEIKARSFVSAGKIRDGQQTYFYTAYADDANGTGFSLTDSTKRYLGTLSSTDEVQSTNPADYQWIALDSKQTLAKIDEIEDDVVNNNQTTNSLISRLSDRQKLAEQELQAKASLAMVQDWIQSYNSYVSSEGEARKEAEKSLKESSQRIVKLQERLDDMSIRYDFVTKFLTASEDGLIISANDGSASARFAEDRISLMSAGQEVMYISQGMLHIENGVFTQSLQIGNFLEMQYKNDKKKNVVVYVGGN